MLNKIRLFIKAIHNNIYLDEYTNRLIFVDKRNYIVNPLKFLLYKKKYPKLFNYLFPIFILFSPLFSWLKISLDFFKSLRLKIKYNKISNKSIFNVENIILYTDENVKYAVDKGRINNYCIVTKPFNTYVIDESRYGIPISSLTLVPYKSLIMNYLISLVSVIMVICRYGYKNTLYSITSYEWLIMFDAMNSDLILKSKAVIFSNQKDRWSILYDQKYKNIKILVQHGTNIVKKLDSAGVNLFFTYLEKHNSFALKVPVKYDNINCLIAFTNEEADHVIAGEFNVIPEIVDIMGYNIVINKIKRLDSRKVILLIGKIDVFYEYEKVIINTIDYNKYKLFIKPHPNTQAYTYLPIYGEENIVNINPDADIIISYNSTLAFEYQSLGYNVYLYDSIENAKEIINYLNALQ